MKIHLVFGDTHRSDGDNIETMNTLDEPVKKNKEDR